MDSRAGDCCIAPYSSVDTIMRRFRPIAPKPSTTSSVSNNTHVPISTTNIKTCRRGKRKVKKVTLPLLPERNDSPSTTGSSDLNSNEIWWNFGGYYHDDVKPAPLMPPPAATVTSMVTVECVMETWGDVLYGVGSTDEEKMMRLEMDVCPGFISDGGDRVVWINGAYRDMVGQHVEDEEVKVWLVVNEKVEMLEYGRVFSCWVRMQYARGKDKCCSLTLPCDVWKMDCGGYAWRLDVNAALSLGR
ncbi:uncharacterized protein LOC124942885 [Impatiens glandulifera]|uniref:uncharacterized protein LOC124942885 n=1 Tax=Impatiens glandulifera TaxID=253017 RepID=UPI001FB05D64|nr:uncharacterized protein LOC124942885 [Impatiens glandulifera]